MKVLKKVDMLCSCCMERHTVQIVAVQEQMIFKKISFDYIAEYHYCNRTDEFFATEKQIDLNDITMKNAYRKKMGLLTTDQIIGIRSKYGISQSDLCLLLGWGAKTITRYETHQVQDNAHDTILRKIDSDPEWFLQLLEIKKNLLSSASYDKYKETATVLFENSYDFYLKSAIQSKYAYYRDNTELNGGKKLSLDVVVDMIHYYANSPKVTNLFLVKLMKMLWYADALSYKQRGESISGLVYRALPMGAVPIAYESIIDLSSIHFDEIPIGDGTGYKFSPDKNKTYANLTSEDKEILDKIVLRFGEVSTQEIIETMHKEDAYVETAPNDVIQYKYAQTLSL